MPENASNKWTDWTENSWQLLLFFLFFVYKFYSLLHHMSTRTEYLPVLNLAGYETVAGYFMGQRCSARCGAFTFDINKLCGRPRHNMPPPPVTLTFDLLTLKVVSESRVTWATSVPILVLLFQHSRVKPDVRDKQTSDAHHLNAPMLGAGA